MHCIIDCIVLVVFFLLISYGMYGIWDSHLLVKQGLSDQYEIYKPTEETASFEQLQRINPEVIGWLEVYGTNIDYPVLQGEDDWKYINTDAKGEYSLTGSLFLSRKNKADFSDFNSIIYGHNMTPKIMFGNIKDFRDKDFFDEHKYGALFDGKEQFGLYFFAMLNVDAYDTSIYRVARSDREAYVEHLRSKALYVRDVQVGPDDRIVLLSTCSNIETNGRDILVGKLTREQYPNSFEEPEKSPFTFMEAAFDVQWSGLPLWARNFLLLLLTAFIALLWVLWFSRRKRRKQKYEKPNKDAAHKGG